MKPQVTKHGTPEELAAAAAQLLVDEMRAALDARGRFFVMLSGGTTPKAMYRVLLEHHRDAMEDFLRTDYFLGDERSVPWDNPQSNAGEAFRLFLDPVGVAQGRRHFANGGAPDLVRESEHATSLMKRIVPANASGVPEFDLVLLGMGTDGHTASLFPGTEALSDPAARFVLNEVPQLQTSRITATYPLINAARHAVILATGENKSQHIADILSREGDPVYPIERIAAQKTSWMLDATAASRLG